jgi:hypothetical protein
LALVPPLRDSLRASRTDQIWLWSLAGPVMRLICAVVVATIAVLTRSDVVSAAANSQQLQGTKLVLSPPPSSNSNAHGNDEITTKRFLRAVKVPSDYSDANDTSSAAFAVSGSDAEERAVKLPSILKNTKVSSAVTNLLTSNKNKMTPAKLRVKFLERLPLELQSNLIFAKVPANLPAKLPSKLPKGVRAAVFKIPGVGDAAAVLQLKIWYAYRVPPMLVFRKLGLYGKGTGEALKKYRTYKYFKAYARKWVASQKKIEF